MAASLVLAISEASLEEDGTLANFNVTAINADESTDTSYRTAISIALTSGGGTLSGTTTASPDTGVATFSGISISGEGTMTITATSGALTAGTDTVSVLNTTKNKISSLKPYLAYTGGIYL